MASHAHDIGKPERVSVELINQSCRWPVLMLFAGALLWLVLGLLLGVLSSVKMHAPAFWANCEWVTFGRLRPGFINVLVYGFATQAALGSALWIVARLSRIELLLGGLVFAGGLLLNAGVAVGLLQILAGQSTGYAWMEIPRQGAAVITAGYLLIALSALYTLHRRTEKELYISAWFLVGGLLAFPWLMSIGYLLAVVNPLRGVMQSVAAAYLQNGLMHLWLTPMALALTYYLLPKVTGREIHSNQAAAFGFWTLILFGAWSGTSLLAGGPVPRWIEGAGVSAKWLLIVPVAAYASNFILTAFAGKRGARSGIAWPFLLFGSLAYVAFILLDIYGTFQGPARTLSLTPYSMGVTQLGLLGFVGMILLGGICHITEKVLDAEFRRPAILVQILFSLVGILMVVGGYVVSGFVSGAKLADPAIPFVTASRSLLPFFGMATLGFSVILLGQLVFVAGFTKLLLHATADSRAGFCSWCCDKIETGSGKKARAGV